MPPESSTSSCESLETIHLLQDELAATNREVMALTLELESRVEERTLELRAAQEELQKTNSELLQLTLELEDRVQERTEEIRRLNDELERRVAKRTAELTAANRDLDSFAYAVSHDLRAPLRAMGGFSQALLEDHRAALPTEAQGYLDQIKLASQRMTELIDGLLVLSRTTRGELRKIPVDLSEFCRKTMMELARSEPDRQVDWQVESGLAAHGDPRMIQALMNNLLGNAWKYTSKVPEARIRVEALALDHQRWIRVKDNGAGFDMAHADRLFNPFQRLHRQDEFPGLGIGLATVQRIVQRHGGRIEASGEAGKGAEFRFTLPEESPEREVSS